MRISKETITVLKVEVKQSQDFDQAAYNIMCQLSNHHISTVVISFKGVGRALADALKSKGVTVIEDAKGPIVHPGLRWNKDWDK